MKKREGQFAAIHDESLLRLHQLHTGVYARIAQKLRVDPSYVSRVASGERQSEKVRKALVAELARIEKVSLGAQRTMRSSA